MKKCPKCGRFCEICVENRRFDGKPYFRFRCTLSRKKIHQILQYTIIRYNKRLMHMKCINDFYPGSDSKVKRAFIPEDKVDWNIEYMDYEPIEYTAPNIKAQPSYADPDICDTNFKPLWNAIDGQVNRKSHSTKYEIINGYPRNYMGRTGIKGRGLLGRWGPNHAADPVVTRWKLENGEHPNGDLSRKRILQFVSIMRRDCRQWAIPGGMVDPGEKITTTLEREFMEEALNSNEMTQSEKENSKEKLAALFTSGKEIYSGYVDDPRNTDNAWMETVAYNFHEESPDGIMYKLKLTAGDDAKAVKWTDIHKDLPLYASHKDIIEKVVQMLNAHW